MAISKKEAIVSLTGREAIYMSYSPVTKHPYVTFDKEASQNQVWLFAEEADVIAFNTKEAQEKKAAVTGMRLEKSQYLPFFSELYSIGVNAVVWKEGEESLAIEIKDIARQPDINEIEPEKRPLYNAALQLAGIHLLQEVRRTVPQNERTEEEKKFVHELDARFCTFVSNSEFILVMLKNEEDPEKVKVPFIKGKDDKVFQPIFSDVLEYQKYVRGEKNALARKVKFTELMSVKLENAAGFMLNPAGINMPLTTQLIESISKKKEAADAIRKEAFEKLMESGKKITELTNKVVELTGKEEFFVAYSAVTRHPYVTCDEESFNDQVWAFATEDEVKAYAQKIAAERKQPLLGMKLEKKNFATWIDELNLIGVNAIVWNDGDKQEEFEVSEIGNPRDYTDIPPEKRPLVNPILQLSAIYFMQEFQRPNVTPEEIDADYRQELQEEMLVNIIRGEYLMVVDTDKEDPSKVTIPFVKTKDDKILHPIFSDVQEMEKFTKGKKMRVMKFPFNKLPDVMIKDAFAFTINPNGVNVILPREQVFRMAGK